MERVLDDERFRKLLRSYPAKAMEFLYEYYYQGLLSMSLGLTHDRRTSEDIVQETFIHIWENHKALGEYQGKSIRHYLARVVKYKSITSFKRSSRRNEEHRAYINGYPGVDLRQSAEFNMISEEAGRRIREIISTFPKRERECLLMKVDEEMSPDQIAAELSVSRKAVERSLTSANKRLRRLLAIKLTQRQKNNLP